MIDKSTAPVRPSASASKRPCQLARNSCGRPNASAVLASKSTGATEGKRDRAAKGIEPEPEPGRHRPRRKLGHALLAQFFGFVADLIAQEIAEPHVVRHRPRLLVVVGGHVFLAKSGRGSRPNPAPSVGRTHKGLHLRGDGAPGGKPQQRTNLTKENGREIIPAVH